MICPVIALSQWKSEIEKFSEEGSLSVCTYHGSDRETQTPRELMKKYDIVLTTYQVVEQDFRKMTSPNRVECPNCGGKFKIDKLPIHLKYFCGDNAQKTEAQARQRRNSGDGGGERRRGRMPSRPFGKGKDKKSQTDGSKTKKKIAVVDKKKAVTARKKSVPKKTPSKSQSTDSPSADTCSRSKRGAAQKAASKIHATSAEWMPPDGESGSEEFQSESESSSDEESSVEDAKSRRGKAEKHVPSDSDGSDGSSSEESDDSALERAREKQRKAMETAKNGKTKVGRKKAAAGKSSNGKKSFGKQKKFDGDDYDDDSFSSDSSSGEGGGGGMDNVDMNALVQQAMDGAKNSVLHSLCWWRIILGA